MKKVLFLIIGFILGVAVITTGYFILIRNDKLCPTNEEKELKQVNLKINELPVTDVNNFEHWEDNESTDTKVTFNIKYNNNATKIEYSKVHINDGSIYQTVTINGREVARGDFGCGGPSFPVIANEMIFIAYKTGCDIFGTSLEIYDFKGNLLNEYEYLDVMTGMRLNKWEIKNNKLLLDGTRSSHGPNILTNKTDMDGYYLCDLDELAKGEVKDSDIIGATYEVSYLDNYKFSNLKMLTDKTITVGEVRKDECK